MVDEPNYEEWIANRQAIEPSSDLVDRIMTKVEDRAVEPRRTLPLADRMNQSQSIRWTACVAAVVVGSLPFLFVARVAYLLEF